MNQLENISCYLSILYAQILMVHQFCKFITLLLLVLSSQIYIKCVYVQINFKENSQEPRKICKKYEQIMQPQFNVLIPDGQ